MKQDFVVTKDFKTPYVVSTGMPHRPTRIEQKRFKKGMIIRGELKHSDGKPAFVLLGETMVMPLDCLKRVITKDVESSSFEGEPQIAPKKAFVAPKDNKTKYADAIIIGGLTGLILSIIAEKRGWVEANEENPLMNKGIGLVVGALMGGYFMYRFGNKEVGKAITIKETTKE